jgi:8-oxo-dGTP pyrophosphatase MutT (NUDIX family)
MDFRLDDGPRIAPLSENSAAPLLVDTLRQRLTEPLPGWAAQMRMSPQPRAVLDPTMTAADLRAAAALLLLYQQGDAWFLPLTVRGARLRQHGGQVSLPGGRIDPGETAEQTAVREALEETGVVPADVMLLGRLTPLPIPISGHLLHPVVGYARSRPRFVIGEHEVERIVEAPLARLRVNAVGWETRQRSIPPIGPMEVPFFEIEGVRVWGATAMVLAEFLAILDDVDPAPSGA